MPDFAWQQHHIDWFVKFFNDSDDIKASSFGRSNIPGIGRKPITKEDRHNLMEMVVKRGLAIATVGTPDSRNYCIRMIPESTEKHYLNCQMLFDDRISDLPQSAWLRHPLMEISFLPNSSAFLFLRWLDHKLEWLEVVNLLRIYMVTGEISKKNVKGNWTDDQQKDLLLMAKREAKLYALICAGWKLFNLTCDKYPSAEELFLDMLFGQVELQFTNYREMATRGSRKSYAEWKQIFGAAECGEFSGDYSQEIANELTVKKLEVFYGEVNLGGGSYAYLHERWAIRFCSGTWIASLGRDCNDEVFLRALKEFREAGKCLLRRELTVSNRARNHSKQDK